LAYAPAAFAVKSFNLKAHKGLAKRKDVFLMPRLFIITLKLTTPDDPLHARAL